MKVTEKKVYHFEIEVDMLGTKEKMKLSFDVPGDSLMGAKNGLAFSLGKVIDQLKLS